MGITVRRCAFAEIEHSPNFPALLAEYDAESGIRDLGAPNPKLATYRMMESAGLGFFIGAFDGILLRGFLIVLVVELPHFSKRVATSESFFVASESRAGGTGLRMLAMAEEIAAEQGAEGILVSAHTGGRLELVLPRVNYIETSRVFFKSLK